MELLSYSLILFLIVIISEQLKRLPLNTIRRNNLPTEGWKVSGWPTQLPLLALHLEGYVDGIPIQLKIRGGERFRRHYRYLICSTPISGTGRFKLSSRSSDLSRGFLMRIGVIKDLGLPEFETKKVFASEVGDQQSFRRLSGTRAFEALLGFTEDDPNFLFMDSCITSEDEFTYCLLFRVQGDIGSAKSLHPILEAMVGVAKEANPNVR